LIKEMERERERIERERERIEKEIIAVFG